MYRERFIKNSWIERKLNITTRQPLKVDDMSEKKTIGTDSKKYRIFIDSQTGVCLP